LKGGGVGRGGIGVVVWGVVIWQAVEADINKQSNRLERIYEDLPRSSEGVNIVIAFIDLLSFLKLVWE